MQNLFLNTNFSLGMVIFFVLLAYVLISVIEYVKGSHHRRLGFWFSKLSHTGGSRRISWPVSIKGHLFFAVSVVLGVLIITFIDDILIESALLVIWVLGSLITTHKKSAKY
jgi:hypothetical protein